MVTEASNNHDVEDTDRWKVTKGCFDHGEFVKMVPATPELRYGFTQINIEIRLDPKPQVVGGQHEHDEAAAP